MYTCIYPPTPLGSVRRVRGFLPPLLSPPGPTKLRGGISRRIRPWLTPPFIRDSTAFWFFWETSWEVIWPQKIHFFGLGAKIEKLISSKLDSHDFLVEISRSISKNQRRYDQYWTKTSLGRPFRGHFYFFPLKSGKSGLPNETDKKSFFQKSKWSRNRQKHVVN